MSMVEKPCSPDYQLDGFSYYFGKSDSKHYPVHHHDDIEIVLLLTSSSANIRWQDEAHHHQASISQGHLCIIPPGQPHSMVWQDNAEYIVMFIRPSLLLKTAQDCGIKAPINIRGIYGKHDPLIRSLTTTIQSAFQEEGVVEHLFIDTLINTLLIYILKAYAGSTFTSNGEESISHQRWLKEVLEYIHNSLDEDLRLSKLAEVAKMSESSFCHLFKEYMNISPHQYVISERIIRAKQLLIKQEMTISEIALACGFNSQSHLTSYFRQHIGVTPKAYQKSY